MIAFKDSKWEVETLDKLPEGTEPQISVEELTECEVIVKRDPTVQKLAKEVGQCYEVIRRQEVKLMRRIKFLGVLPEQIFADGWSIGFDERFPKSVRIQQALLFARFSEHGNLYAHPLVWFIPSHELVCKP